ncbi:hypothetical protein QYF36_000821 [Acer negundo]|nr:hypothetical protein QYF36_000821 [Acer negundo]
MSYSMTISRSLPTANVKEKIGFGDSRPLSSNPIVRDFVPSSGWTEDSNARYLLVDLPADPYTATGFRYQQHLWKFRFRTRDFLRDCAKACKYCTTTRARNTKSEIENTNSIVEEHKQETLRNDENVRGGHVDREEKREKNSRVDDFPEEAIKKCKKEPNHQLIIRAMRMLMENKQIVFTTLLAFSLGAWVSRKVGSRGHV